MWFKLNTTFTQSLGTLSELSNSWSITRNLTNYSTTSTTTSVAKDGTYSATFTLNAGCTYSSHSVTMGGATVSSASTASATAYKYDSSTHTITFSNFKVTGALVITAVATGASSGGGGSEGDGGTNGDDSTTTPTTTTYYGTSVNIISDPAELDYVAGYNAGTADKGFTESTGRACSTTQCLKVTGGSTVKLTQTISGLTLTYAIKEFTELPLAQATLTSGGQSAGSWLSGNTTLKSATNYIVIIFKKGTTDFTSNELELLKQAITIS